MLRRLLRDHDRRQPAAVRREGSRCRKTPQHQSSLLSTPRSYGCLDDLVGGQQVVVGDLPVRAGEGQGAATGRSTRSGGSSSRSASGLDQGEQPPAHLFHATDDLGTVVEVLLGGTRRAPSARISSKMARNRCWRIVVMASRRSRSGGPG